MRITSFFAAFAASALLACGSSGTGPCTTGGFCTGADAGDLDSSLDPDTDPFGNQDGSVETQPPCVNLQCQQVTCQSGDTTITGKVYDPGGKTPLYNVFVYVPNAPLLPIDTGPKCTACQAPASGNPVVSATTDEKGEFVIHNVPVGQDIPLVMQLGKWRRRITLPSVTACVDNNFNTKKVYDPGVDKTTESLMRLPKKQVEGSPDDNIPLMAMVTGSCDYAECFLANTIGIDPSEFGGTNTTKRVRLYRGNDSSSKQLPAGTGTGLGLWGSYAEMAKYDIIFGACECSDYDRTTAGYTNMKKYLEAGGRMFGTHYYYNFFASPTGPTDFDGVAKWNTGGYDNDLAPYYVDQTFPKGKAMASWLFDVKATTTQGRLDNLYDLRHDVDQIVTPKATRWLYSGQQSGNTYKTLYMSFNTPVNKPVVDQCGRAVFSDVHLSGSSYTSYTSQPFPQWCGSRAAGSGYENNEAALEFLFFDLASCVQDDQKPPVVPPPN